MSLFGRGRGAPARPAARVADARTGQGPAGGPSGTSVPLAMREPDAWRAGHVPGAVRLPLRVPAVGAGLPTGTQGRTAAVIRRRGRRCLQGVEPPRAKGVEAAGAIGDMRGCSAAELPAVNGAVG
ncbi:rhodanese-like domain-containing protein [Streptomyces sp. NPDC046759]|uniref:rhodanese-like domain-containing protein n=1 Tax=Streptomyces sp. NPDC046759 TaxID=3155019 RepID=UPI0033D9260B